MPGRSLPFGRRTALIAGAVVAMLTASCGGASSGASSIGQARAHEPAAVGAQAANSATLRISGFSFGPALTVSRGEKITIVNADSAPHTVTADRGNAFDVSVPASGTATMTAPATAGSYPFHCRIHPSMTSVLTVR